MVNDSKDFFMTYIGLDSSENFEEWYHARMRLAAENDDYAKAILETAEDIIENKSYSRLKSILCNYDCLVKNSFNWGESDFDLPYWYYCLGYKNPEQEE